MASLASIGAAVAAASKVMEVGNQLHGMVSKMQWATEERERLCERIDKLLNLLKEVEKSETDNKELR